MKHIKRILPLFLAVCILTGGIWGGYALREAIPSYKGTITEANQKQKDNPLLLIDGEESILFYPWDQYDPSSCLKYSDCLKEEGKYDAFVHESLANTFYSSLSTRQKTRNSNGANPYSLPAWEDVAQVIYENLLVQTTDDGYIYYLPETKIHTEEIEYYIKAAAQDSEQLRYFTCRDTPEKDLARLSSEKLRSAASYVNSCFDEVQSLMEAYQAEGLEYGYSMEDYNEYAEYNFWNEYLPKAVENNPLALFMYQNPIQLNLYNLGSLLNSQKDILAYREEILVVFSYPEVYLNFGYRPQSLILFYDPTESSFIGFSAGE